MTTSEQRRNNVIRSIPARMGYPETDLYVPPNASLGGTTGGPPNNYGANSRSNSPRPFFSTWRDQKPPTAARETVTRRKDLGRF